MLYEDHMPQIRPTGQGVSIAFQRLAYPDKKVLKRPYHDLVTK